MKSFFRCSHEEGYLSKNIFEFMISTGCRIGETVALEKNDINWSNQSSEEKMIRKGKFILIRVVT